MDGSLTTLVNATIGGTLTSTGLLKASGNMAVVGNVGIGIAVPTCALHVVGAGNITGHLSVGGSLTSTGMIHALGCILASKHLSGDVVLYQENSNALFSVGALTHRVGLIVAICPVGSVPTAAQKLLTLDVDTGAYVNTA